MNQLKRNVLLGAALGLMGATGVALAQEAAPAAPQPAAKAAPAAQPGAPKAAAATKADAKKADAKDKAKEKGKDKEGPGGEADAAPVDAAEKERRAKIAKSRAAAAAKLPKEARRARLTGMREYKRAERELKMAQKARLEGGPDSEKAVKDAEARAEAARKKGLEALVKTQQARARAGKPLNDKQRAALDAALKADAEKRAADRKERGDTEREALKKAWGKKLDAAPLLAELRRHAWRVARLERLVVIGQAMEQDHVVDKAQRLLEMENEKHEKRMAALAEGKVDDQPAAVPTKGAAPGVKGPSSVAGKPASQPQPVKPAAPAAAAKEGAQ